MIRWLLCLVFVVGCAGSRKMVTSFEAGEASPARAWSNEQVIPKLANNPDEPPFLNGWPQHVARAGYQNAFPDINGRLIITTSFSVPPPLVLDTLEYSPHQPQLRVFEIKKYRAIFHGAERKEFDKRLSDLKAALSGDVVRFPEILPAVEAYPIFYCSIAAVCGEDWKAVHAVSMYAQDNCLVENGRLFYTLQGLSDDERYWIAAYWPVEAEGIRMQSHDLSADEIAILNSPELYAEYLTEQLEILEAATYYPPLESIDEIVSGLKLETK